MKEIAKTGAAGTALMLAAALMLVTSSAAWGQNAPEEMEKSKEKKPGLEKKESISQNSLEEEAEEEITEQKNESLEDRVAAFKERREQFLRERKELLKQLMKANGENRAEIREELRERLEGWLEQNREGREEFKNRVKKITQEFRNNEMEEVIEAAKANADEARERHGQD